MKRLHGSKKLKAALSVLLCVCLAALSMTAGYAAVVVTRKASTVKVAAGGKIVGVKESAVDGFSVKGMLPGDSETRTFFVTIWHTGIIYVDMNVKKASETNGVCKCLHLRVSERSHGLLYDGSLSDALGRSLLITYDFTGHINESLIYDVTVSMDSSAGNEYQRSSAKISLTWNVS